MKNHLTLLGILVIGCGIFAFSHILQRAQARLSPEMLAKMAAQKGKGWAGFLLPMAPLLVAYLLVDYFPNHQAWVAVPALLLGFGLLVLDLAGGGKRMRELGLPDEYRREVRKANLVCGVSLLAGVALLAAVHWRVFLIPVDR